MGMDRQKIFSSHLQDENKGLQEISEGISESAQPGQPGTKKGLITKIRNDESTKDDEFQKVDKQILLVYEVLRSP